MAHRPKKGVMVSENDMPVSPSEDLPGGDKRLSSLFHNRTALTPFNRHG
jgi:hypothetical protein